MDADTLLINGTVTNHNGTAAQNIAIKDGRIIALGDTAHIKTAEVIDCKGLNILPGVVDTQVHFREPGATHKEDLETGSRAAILGGVTGVFEMPNTNPTTTTIEALHAKLAAAKNRMHCNYAFFFGGNGENITECAKAETIAGCAGIKIFMGSSTGSLLLDDTEKLRETFANGGTNRVSIHSENEALLNATKDRRRENDPASHSEWRSVEVAVSSTQRLLKLAHETGRQVHVLHISTGEEMDILMHHKDIATVELTPHHLCLDADKVYPELGTKVQMNPPIRGQSHIKRLWQALQDGTVDVLGSDHAPHTLDEKSLPYPNSPSGMPGVQTLVPVMLDRVNKGDLTLERFVDLTSHGPQRLFRIARKGRIAVGYDADFTIVDMHTKRTINNNWIASKCGWTPYHDLTVSAWPIMTIINGHIVMRDDEIITTAQGQPIQTQQTIRPS